MNKNELAQIITESIKELGFARIARAAILDVFASSESPSFAIHDELKEFAASRDLEFENEGDNFVVFRPLETER